MYVFIIWEFYMCTQSIFIIATSIPPTNSTKTTTNTSSAQFYVCVCVCVCVCVFIFQVVLSICTYV